MREVLELVPGCEHGRAPLALEPLAGGSVNRTLRVTSAAGQFVVRIAGEHAERLGASRHRELAFQRLAAAAGIAPELVAVSTDQRVTVARYVAGRTWTAADLGRARSVQRLGERLRDLRQLAVPAQLQCAPFEPTTILLRLGAQAIAALPGDQALIETVLDQAQRALRSAGDAGRRGSALLHLDLHPRNVIEGEQLVFLDWEYAAWGDPALELASIAAGEPAIEPHLEHLRHASGLAPLLSGRELEALRTVFEATHWLWYRARRLAQAAPAAEQAAERDLLERLSRRV